MVPNIFVPGDATLNFAGRFLRLVRHGYIFSIAGDLVAFTSSIVVIGYGQGTQQLSVEISNVLNRYLVNHRLEKRENYIFFSAYSRISSSTISPNQLTRN
jgi:hypothetical protein